MKIIISFFNLLWLGFLFPLLALSPENLIPPYLTVAANGKFIPRGGTDHPRSTNGRFWCQYDIVTATDEIREIRNFRLFEDGKPRFHTTEIPGSDFYISNSGLVASLDTRQHFLNRLTLHFFSPDGSLLFSHTVKGASLFGFSPSGKLFGVGNAQEILLISPEDQQITTLPGGFQFAVSEDDEFVAVAGRDELRLYSHGKYVRDFRTGFANPRKVCLSWCDQMLAVIEKQRLKVFAPETGQLLFSASQPARYAFRDLEIVGGNILAGVHFKESRRSTGLIYVYTRDGQLLPEQIRTFQPLPQTPKSPEKKTLNGEQIPWPFFPFDQTPTIWNYYEQHMGGYGWEFSYLHQGLDIITPVNMPTFAVADGVVKCVLTLGGAIYWRLAISPEQNSGWSRGWLYAHLVESSIQFEPGDSVHVGDYLGDIIHWYDDWGHIHFVEISDSGQVWQYDDNEWGITFNPLQVLPVTDSRSPFFRHVFPNQKFAFCGNESGEYLPPDSLSGKFDLIANIADYVGDSDWQQPPYETFYWVQSGDSLVFPRTLGQRLNHAFPFYASENYEPFATLLYQRNPTLFPGSWMNKNRNYHLNLTNNNGDSLADLSETDLAFNSTDFPDGNYSFFVEARDISGNTTVDSQNVKFKNGNLNGVKFLPTIQTAGIRLQIFPNPFNSTTQVEYSLPVAGEMQLQIFDVLGRLCREQSEKSQTAGAHRWQFDAGALASGIYWLRLTTVQASCVQKMVLLR